MSVLCLAAGIAAALRLLPSLGTDSVSVLATWTVGTLLGAAVAVVGLEAYQLARALGDEARFGSESDSDAVAFYGAAALHYGGVLLGLAALVYFVALRSNSRP